MQSHHGHFPLATPPVQCPGGAFSTLVDVISRDCSRQLGLLSLEEDELWPLARTSRCFCLGCCTDRVRVVVVGGGAKRRGQGATSLKEPKWSRWSFLPTANVGAAPLSWMRSTPLPSPLSALRSRAFVCLCNLTAARHLCVRRRTITSTFYARHSFHGGEQRLADPSSAAVLRGCVA